MTTFRTCTKVRRPSVLSALAGCCLAMAFATPHALADVYNIADGDVAGLVAAINDANVAAGPHTINLASGGSYTLEANLPTITVAGLTINGNGAVISGASEYRIFTIDLGAEVEVYNLNMTQAVGNGRGGAIQNAGDLAVIGCVITSSSAPARGGAIYNAGTLFVGGSTLSGNLADDGGAIHNDGGTVIIVGGSMSGNETFELGTGGGAIYNKGGDVTISGGALLEGNTASQGGAIVNEGTLTITESTINDNTCDGLGGGIFSMSGTVWITASTISLNTAVIAGGGVTVYGGTFNILNSTISGNAAGLVFGGGILNLGTVNMLHGTVVLNAAGISGGGIADLSEGTEMHNSLIAGNTADGSPDDISGDVSGASSFNLVGDAATSGGLTDSVSGNIVGVSAASVFNFTLADNGGPTKTHALLFPGPAIDAGDPQLVETIPYDQRGPGFDRISGDSVDIGAFEFQQVIQYQGLGIGFWKTKSGSSYWLETAYAKTDLIGSAFGPAYPGAYGGSTLIQALNFGGGPGPLGAERILLRQAVAAILNASHPGINYPLSISQIVTAVQTAVDSGDPAAMHALEQVLEGYNNLGL